MCCEPNFGSDGDNQMDLMLADLVKPMDEEEGIALPPAALTHMTLNISKLPANLIAIMALPQLEQLELIAEGALSEMMNALKPEKPEAAAAGVQQQQLVSPLRSIIALASKGDARMQVLATIAPNLIHLQISSLDSDGWLALSGLQKLQQLEKHNKADANFPLSAHFGVLAALPYFTRLIFHCEHGESCRAMITAAHVQSWMKSRMRSWNRIDLHDTPVIKVKGVNFSRPGKVKVWSPTHLDINKSLDEADENQLMQLRVHLIHGSLGDTQVWRLMREESNDGESKNVVKWMTKQMDPPDLSKVLSVGMKIRQEEQEKNPELSEDEWSSSEEESDI